MQIVLIPGFWLDGESWAPITDVLVAAGHDVRPLTLPGKSRAAAGTAGADLAGIGLRTHVDAVLDLVDTLDGPVTLVGHSGGGTIAWAAADARPDRVARVVLVDALPMPSGTSINTELPVEGDAVPLPAWELFEPEDLIDLDDALRERFRTIAVPEPKGVAHEPTTLHDERRFAVPVTVIACQFPEALVRQAIENGRDWASELARIEQLSFIELPTGHWPQLTKPDELAQSILAAVGG